MGDHRAPRRRGRTVLRLLLSGVLVGAGAVALTDAESGRDGTAPVFAAATPALVGGTVPVEVAAPTRVQIPSLGVDSPLARLGLDAAGALIPPADFDQAGWFAEGPAPGEVGPAVIAGHVDSWTGPAVFFRLAEIAVGEVVLVGRSDGTTARFTVTRVERHPKDAFPTTDVYGPTADAQLRLITCGGAFDPDDRRYVDNVVVYAALTG